MLAFDPAKRFSAEQCLNHPYFDNLRNSKDIVASEKKFRYDLPEATEMSKDQLRDVVWEEIDRFRPYASNDYFHRPIPEPATAGSTEGEKTAEKTAEGTAEVTSKLAETAI